MKRLGLIATAEILLISAERLQVRGHNAAAQLQLAESFNDEVKRIHEEVKKLMKKT